MLKITETEASELILDSYLMQIHTTLCDRRGSGERYGQLYEVWVHPVKTPKSGYKEFRPARGALKDLPIAYVDMAEQRNSVCSDCVHTYQTRNNQPALPAVSAQAWAETLKRKYTPEVKEPKVARSAGAAGIPAPTPDEL